MLGYTTLTIGIALILRPAPRDVAAAAVLGTIVGVLRLLARGRRSLEVLMPFLAAFAVALLTALAVKHDVTDPGLRAMIAALVVFIPGVALTTAVLELTEGQMISGSSRLVWAATQLGLIAFGIVAGVSAAGVPAERAFSSSDALLGDWAPWLGVLVYAVGVTVAHSTPPGALLSLLVVLYAAWTGQVVGDALFGAYSSGFVGAVVMTLVAYQLARLQSTMPVYAMFLPGFWLLVPGSLGLIGLTTFLAFPDSASGADVFAVIGAIAAVALGVLCGVELHRWLVGRRAAGPGRHATRADARCLSAPRASSTPCTTATAVRTTLAARTSSSPRRDGRADRRAGIQPVLERRPADHEPAAEHPDHARPRPEHRGSTAARARRRSRPASRCSAPASRRAGPARRRPTSRRHRRATAATAIRHTSRRRAAPSPRGLGSLMADDATTAPRGAAGDAAARRSRASRSRRSSSSSTGRCSGSRSARAGRRPPMRSPPPARRRRPRRSWPATATRPHDAALPFAWSTAATIEPLVEGKSFFPRIFADVEAAQSSVHILMFGWREGEVGMEMAALLRRKLDEGVEVRVIVDSFGSRPYEEAREMFTRPRRGGRRRSSSTTSSRSTATASSPTARASTGARTRWAAPTTASCT